MNLWVWQEWQQYLRDSSLLLDAAYHDRITGDILTLEYLP
jgi:hypothetical protein